MKKKKYTKKQLAMFIAGLTAFVIGFSILSFYGIRKINREIHRYMLMKENVVLEIPELDIKAPVLEGTDNDTLAVAVGHFENTGDVGKGNYCIAGHSSVIYKEYFNSIKKIKTGMKVNLYDVNKKLYEYKVTDYSIIEPDETWVLDDFGDDRVTIITCTDDGKQRQCVIAKLNK